MNNSNKGTQYNLTAKFNIGDTVISKQSAMPFEIIGINFISHKSDGFTVSYTSDNYKTYLEDDLQIFNSCEHKYRLSNTYNYYKDGEWTKIYEIEHNGETFCVSLEEYKSLIQI